MNENALRITEPKADLEVMAFYEEAQKLLTFAQTRNIVVIEDLKPATEDLAVIARVKKGMEAKRKEYLAPFQSHVKETNEAYRALMAPIEEADNITREKMLAFNREQEERRRKQEEVNRLNEELGQSDKVVEVAPAAPETTRTDIGTSGMTANWKWEVLDLTIVPDAYKVIDSSQLTAIARKHHDTKTIPGVRFYCEKTIAVRANRT